MMASMDLLDIHGTDITGVREDKGKNVSCKENDLLMRNIIATK